MSYKNLIRETDEHWLDNLIGLSLNKKIQYAIHRQAQKETLEYLIELAIKGKLKHPNLHETVFQACSNNKGKILDIAINMPNDLILDNFGNFYAAIVRTPVSATATFTLNDIAPSAQTVAVYQQYTASILNYTGGGTQLQVGKGTTTPLRTNTSIETAMGTAPESTRFGTGAGSYANGYISFAAAITAGGADTVNETGYFNYGFNTAGAFKTFMMFHDKLGAGVSFVAGNTLTTSYSIAI